MKQKNDESAGSGRSDGAWMRGVSDFCEAHMSVVSVVAVFAGGAVGSLVRLAFSLLWPSPSVWHGTTLMLNLTGAFLLAALTELFSCLGDDSGLHKVMRLGLCTGCIGGYTTYSTFIVEADRGLMQGSFLTALAYMLVSIVVGLFCSAAGIVTGGKVGYRIATHSEGGVQ